MVLDRLTAEEKATQMLQQMAQFGITRTFSKFSLSGSGERTRKCNIILLPRLLIWSRRTLLTLMLSDYCCVLLTLVEYNCNLRAADTDYCESANCCWWSS